MIILEIILHRNDYVRNNIYSLLSIIITLVITSRGRGLFLAYRWKLTICSQVSVVSKIIFNLTNLSYIYA